jgi:hypothetical protein
MGRAQPVFFFFFFLSRKNNNFNLLQISSALWLLKTVLRFLKEDVNILTNFNYVIIIPVDFHEKINIRLRLLNYFLYSENNYKNLFWLCIEGSFAEILQDCALLLRGGIVYDICSARVYFAGLFIGYSMTTNSRRGHAVALLRRYAASRKIFNIFW